MKRLFQFALLAASMLLATCSLGSIPFSGPQPSPRDIDSPVDLPPDLAALRIPWQGEGSIQQRGTTLRLDGSEPIVPPEGCGTPSPDERYLICLSFLGASIELLDRGTGERTLLVSKERDFPSATSLSYARFTPDGKEIVFTVGWQDHTDIAFVDVETGAIELLDAPGIFNSDPVVSPDGRQILVSCEGRQPGAGFVLCMVDRRTGNRVYLIDEATNLARTGKFTPDGNFVVFGAPLGGFDGEGQIRKIALARREDRVLVSGLYPTAIVLGAEASSVAFTCRFPERPACSWVCVVDLEGKDVRRLTYLGESCLDLEDDQ